MSAESTHLNAAQRRFISNVEALLRSRYSIGISDCSDESEILRSYDTSETPEQFVEWIGDKYGLTRTDEAW